MKERETGLMESLGSRSIRRRDRVREKHRKKLYSEKYSISMCALYIRVFNEHVLYKS